MWSSSILTTSGFLWIIIACIRLDLSIVAASSLFASSSGSSSSKTKNVPVPKEKVEEEEDEPTLSPPEPVQLKPRIINFNIMIAGLSGLGKTTLCETLLDSWTETPIETTTTTGGRKLKASAHRSRPTRQTMEVQVSSPLEWHDRVANTILRVRIIDTPGFGNQINHQNSVQIITGYIQRCRREQLQLEQSKNPMQAEEDERLVHVCLYFLSPGRFLEIDRHFLRHVQKEIPIVPIIAKADTLTNEEIVHYRAMLKRTCQKEKIQIYDFDLEQSSKSAIVNAATSALSSSNFNRGRRKGEALAIIARDGSYPWGKARSFDPNHSDLKLIRDLLLSEHTEKLLERSKQQYLNFRNRMIQKAKLMEILKYAALVGLMGLQLTSILQEDSESSDEESASSPILSRIRKILGAIVPSRKKKNHTEADAMQADAVDANEADETVDDSGSSSSSSWFRGKNWGIFGAPDYKDSFPSKS
eukprot:scaffold22634_cov123-Cylindrotheca_fusiformis.AAC.6